MNADGTRSTEPLRAPHVRYRDDGSGFIFWQDGGRTEFTSPPRPPYRAPQPMTRFLVMTLVAALAALAFVAYTIAKV